MHASIRSFALGIRAVFTTCPLFDSDAKDARAIARQMLGLRL